MEFSHMHGLVDMEQHEISCQWRFGGREWQKKKQDLRQNIHALEKEMATHSSVLAWRIPGTAEPSGLPSMGSHRVGHDWSDLAAAAAAAFC